MICVGPWAYPLCGKEKTAILKNELGMIDESNLYQQNFQLRYLRGPQSDASEAWYIQLKIKDMHKYAHYRYMETRS